MQNDEISRLQNIISGKSNIMEEVLGLGLDRYNKKNKIKQEGEAKEGGAEKKKGIFDQIIDIGPGAGIHGGEIIFQGPLKDIYKEKKNISSFYT